MVQVFVSINGKEVHAWNVEVQMFVSTNGKNMRVKYVISIYVLSINNGNI
jgi:hypothetical protein